MGWRDLFGGRTASATESSAHAEAQRPAADPAQQVAALVHSGEKIEAIKLYREEYGVSLADAKEAIDVIARGEATPTPSPAAAPNPATASGPQARDDDVEALLREGRLIDAISLYREHNGVSLAEAKEAVDRMR